jgi:hypothetical protein
MTTQTPHGPAPVKAGTYPPHELALRLPRPNEAQYEASKADIAANGLNDPIVLYEGKILDGITRDKICGELGIVPRYESYQGNNPAAFVASKNLPRRHLTDIQRVMLAAQFAAECGRTEAAEQFNVSPASIAKAEQIRRNAVPEITAGVERGEIFPSNAAAVAKLPHDKQREIARRGSAAVNEAGKFSVAKFPSDPFGLNSTNIADKLFKEWKKLPPAEQAKFLAMIERERESM